MKIYHNDIKPANIMTDKNGMANLVDIDSISFEVREFCPHTIAYSPCKYFIKINLYIFKNIILINLYAIIH